MLSEQAICQAARALGEAAASRPARVILFGSYARGDAREDSDVDFLVIEPEVRGRHAEMVRLHHIAGAVGVPADILLASETQVQARASVPGSILREALVGGRVVFDGA